MGLRNLHTFDAEYASAYGILKALYAFAKRKHKGAKSDPTFNYVAQFACREGAWLAAAKDLGSSMIVGIDTRDAIEMPLCIDTSEFKDMDLAKVKVNLPRKSDLLICVEYVHELNTTRGEDIVADICNSSDQVLFSSGVPYQGNHPEFNYQWQSHWAALFYKEGYVPNPRFREHYWSDKTIDPVYRQNCVFYTRAAKLPKKAPDFRKLDVIHPAIFEAVQVRQQALAMQLTNATIRKLLKKKED
jgi:hypothetical protein